MSSPSGKRRKFSVDALFTDTTPRGAGVAELVDAKLIDIDRIDPDPEQPRTTFNDDSLAELAESIRSEGVLQPIAVRYDDASARYVILHGERRWRASQLAGLTAIPAIVRDVPRERRLVQQLIENIVREDLNALDRAAGLRALKAQMGDPAWDVVAAAVGIRRSRLFQLLGTQKLDATLQDALRSGLISEKQTRQLQGLEDAEQRRIGEALLSGELKAADLAAQLRKPKRDASPAQSDVGRRNLPPEVERVRVAALDLNAALGGLDGAAIEALDARTAEALLVALRALDDRLRAAMSSIREQTDR